MLTYISFFAFTAFVAVYSWYRLRNDKLTSQDGYFLGGRSLTGVMIAGSMLLTNISTEHLVGMNGSSYKNGFIIVAWEVTSALALIVAALYFVPTYLKMGLTTIPQYLEQRFDSFTRTLVALFLIISFVVTLLPIVSIHRGHQSGKHFQCLGGPGHQQDRRALDHGNRDRDYWLGLCDFWRAQSCGTVRHGQWFWTVYRRIAGSGTGAVGHRRGQYTIRTRYRLQGHPGKVQCDRKAKTSVLPFSTLFTGLVINQLYFWGMNQTIIQRAFGAKNLAEAQKGLLYTGVLKLFVPIIIVLPGVIGFYYFGDSLFDRQDMIYPELVKKVMPLELCRLFCGGCHGGGAEHLQQCIEQHRNTISALGFLKGI
jgi:SSS family solute:Na+ symporter